jgi:hypothetical protein
MTLAVSGQRDTSGLRILHALESEMLARHQSVGRIGSGLKTF